ncbi:zinc finger MYM-type protein 1-like [Prunus avium]|uniref:Zinc finger MYM-type protein 1-like n=1 Tax=Prunus avium TaxID=42229 RepID=A0A6P5TKH2_PRUAV|nr:zinc finger MYM-type protein 1-like [Prunus avium]
MKLTSPDIHKDISCAISTEIINAIIRDIGDSLFAILVDESCDMSSKEQMAIVLRYVDKGRVIERFVGIVHVTDTKSSSLKLAVDDFFSRHGLSISRLRGQGYDGASNMRALVVVAKKHSEIAGLFTMVSNVVNVVGASAKRRDMLREKHADAIFEALNNNELLSGQGLNQEIISHITFLKSNSYYSTLLNFKHIEILGITNDLSQALQKKDQDIVNAMDLVKICKGRLQSMRDNGWDSLLDQVSFFCGKYHIEIPKMDDIFSSGGRPKRKAQPITNLHHYRVDLFVDVIDIQLRELNDRFNEKNTELLLCMACLSPSNSFSAFDKAKLMRLAQFYPRDFSKHDLKLLEDQLENYIWDVSSNNEFTELKGISDLAQKMVETNKDKIYPLVYLLLTLALILSVATASVERVFSAMNIVKNRLRNRMGDLWMNDSLVAYIEKDIFNSIDDEVVMQRFQNMKTRRGQL